MAIPPSAAKVESSLDQYRTALKVTPYAVAYWHTVPGLRNTCRVIDFIWVTTPVCVFTL